MNKAFLLSLHRMLRMFGLDPLQALQTCRRLPQYYAASRQFWSQQKQSDSSFAVGRVMPCLGGRDGEGGTARGHYFHQDLLVAQRIFENHPQRHIDVGSRVDGLIAHIASFRNVEVFDIRPMSVNIPNITFRQADLMQLPEEYKNCCDSLSCLHALEHFGLGRYGDPLAPNGHLQGLTSLTSMLKAEGTLYLSVPMGPLRVEFNAHRVFSLDYLLKHLEADYQLQAFSYVDDRGDLHRAVEIAQERRADSFGCSFGLAIFELQKKDHHG